MMPGRAMARAKKQCNWVACSCSDIIHCFTIVSVVAAQPRNPADDAWAGDEGQESA